MGCTIDLIAEGTTLEAAGRRDGFEGLGEFYSERAWPEKHNWVMAITAAAANGST